MRSAVSLLRYPSRTLGVEISVDDIDDNIRRDDDEGEEERGPENKPVILDRLDRQGQQITDPPGSKTRSMTGNPAMKNANVNPRIVTVTFRLFRPACRFTT